MQVKAIDEAGCDWVHVDVMDGRFVPNITIGPLVVDALRPVTEKPLDVHLVRTPASSNHTISLDLLTLPPLETLATRNGLPRRCHGWPLRAKCHNRSACSGSSPACYSKPCRHAFGAHGQLSAYHPSQLSTFAACDPPYICTKVLAAACGHV
jgi:hypothetical protein